jgi:hypothetical protein
MLGLLHLNDDISAGLAAEVIESVKLLGIFIARDEVKRALADRMKWRLSKTRFWRRCYRNKLTEAT